MSKKVNYILQDIKELYFNINTYLKDAIMYIFVKPRETTTPLEKDSVTAMLIYEALKIYNGKISAVFQYAGLDVPMPWIKWVKNDTLRLEEEMIAYVKANPECTAGQVVANSSSAYLTVNTIGTDLIKYCPTYDEERTFVQFKAAVLAL